MERPILQVSAKKYTGESAVVSLRIPKDMLLELDSVAEQTGRTRNELMSMCLEFALEHMEVQSIETERENRPFRVI